MRRRRRPVPCLDCGVVARIGRAAAIAMRYASSSSARAGFRRRSSTGTWHCCTTCRIDVPRSPSVPGASCGIRWRGTRHRRCYLVGHDETGLSPAFLFGAHDRDRRPRHRTDVQGPYRSADPARARRRPDEPGPRPRQLRGRQWPERRSRRAVRHRRDDSADGAAPRRGDRRERRHRLRPERGGDFATDCAATRAQAEERAVSEEVLRGPTLAVARPGAAGQRVGSVRGSAVTVVTGAV